MIDNIFFKLIDIAFFMSIAYVVGFIGNILFRIYGYVFADNPNMTLDTSKQDLYILLLAFGIILSELIK